MKDRRLYLIDATAFCYRAFYAIRGLSTSFGQPTNAIFGFLNMLNKILKESKPQFIATCFDVSRDTFRQKKLAQYKIQRPPMPDDLGSQIPLIKEIIQAYGIAIYEKEGFEADDLIATLAVKAKSQKLKVTIITADKDMLQLVDEDIIVFNPHKEEGMLYNPDKIEECFGVSAQRIPEVISLMGDDADNIPGVPGVGEKTAVGLIKNFNSLEDLLENTAQIKQEKIRKAVEDNIEKIRLNQELVQLNKNLDIDFSLDRLAIGQPDYDKLSALFRKLEFKVFLRDLPISQDQLKEEKVIDLKDSELESLLRNGLKEIYIYKGSANSLLIYAQDKVYSLKETSNNLKNLLEDSTIKKIGHDLKKLKVSLDKENICLKGLYFDTLIAAYLLNPARADYGLVDLAWDYLGKSLRLDSLSDINALTLIISLKEKISQELEDKDLAKLFYDIEMPLVNVLAEMELNGIKIDLAVLKQVSSEIEKGLVKLIEDIYRMSGCQFNINSPKQLREVLFEKLKLPVVKRSKTGPSTDEEVLRNLAGKHELPALLLDYRQLMKLKNTYVDTLPNLIDKRTGRIHSSFNQTGTETGRLSSSNPNLQNIPVRTEFGRRIRQAIIADEESSLLSYDYSQIELRVLAHLSKDENLIAAFREDKDIHRSTAALIYGLDEKDIDDSMRDVAKRVNFGIIYGLTSYGLSRDLKVTLDEAQRFIDAYFLRYPRVEGYLNQEIEKAREKGFVTTLLGRRRYIPDINSKNQAIRQFAQRQAVNAPIQGSASDLIKIAMVNIDQEINKNKFLAKLIIQVHDELVFDVPDKEIDSFLNLAKDKMENVLKLDVPIKVSIKRGKNWLMMDNL
jgi:DNA polymerase-1